MKGKWHLVIFMTSLLLPVMASDCIKQLSVILKYMRSDKLVNEESSLTYRQLANHMGLTSMKFVTDIG